MADKNGLPKHDGQLVHLTPAAGAKSQTRDTDISSSTEITLNAASSILEVNALDGNIYMKYGTTDVTNANFDEFIQSGATRHYIIPNNVAAVNFIDDGDSATLILIEK